MARHSGNGKNTVEGCRSIDVLEWHRLGHLQLPGCFSCAWASDSECVASIDVQAQRHFVALKYRSRSCNHNWSDPVRGSPSHGQRAGSGESGPGLFVRLLQRACTAVAVSTICTVPGDCSPAAIAISLLMRANGNRPICGGLKITKGPNAAGWKPEHA